MFRIWYQQRTLLLFLLLLSWGQNALTDQGEKEKSKPEYKWSVTLYGGAHAQPDLGHILIFQASFPDDTYIGAVAMARELWRYKDWVSFEVEGQIAKHFGWMDHWEFNGLFILRWLPFPWDEYLETSLAVGDGMSYATEVPEVEKEDIGLEDADRWLNYLLFELTMGLPQYPQWNFVLRIHHRSGIYGVVKGIKGGANFVCGGIKYSF